MCFDNEGHYWQMQKKRGHSKESEKEAMAAGAVQLSFEINCNVIICLTETGTMARWVSRFRPKAHVIAAGYDESVIRSLNISRGIMCLHVPTTFTGLFLIFS